MKPFKTSKPTIDRDSDRVVNTEKSTEAASTPHDPQPDVAYVIYTSDSIGNPQGVFDQDRSIANTFRWFVADTGNVGQFVFQNESTKG